MELVAAVARVVVILVGFGLFVFGVLLAVGVVGSATVVGIGVAGIGLALMFIAWKRIWGELVDLFLIP